MNSLCHAALALLFCHSTAGLSLNNHPPGLSSDSSVEASSLTTLHDLFYPPNSDAFLILKNLIDSATPAGAATTKAETTDTLVRFFKAYLERRLLDTLLTSQFHSQDKIEQIIYYLGVLKRLDAAEGSVTASGEAAVKKLLAENLAERRQLLAKLKQPEATEEETTDGDETETDQA